MLMRIQNNWNSHAITVEVKKKKICKSLRKTVWQFLKVKCVRKIYKKTCTRMFIEALFLRAKNGNKPKVYQQEYS